MVFLEARFDTQGWLIWACITCVNSSDSVTSFPIAAHYTVSPLFTLHGKVAAFKKVFRRRTNLSPTLCRFQQWDDQLYLML